VTLAGTRIALFGGSSGIGLATAQLAQKERADVTVVSRNAEKLARAARTLGSCETVSIDIRDPDAVAAFFQTRAPFDHIVVSAAALDPGPLRAQDLATARAAMDSKFWGAVHVAHAANISPGGSLTLVSGMLGSRPAGNATLLSAINAALDRLAQALALELAPTRVNCVSPGRIDSPWWDHLPEQERQALFAATAARLPVRRIGNATDIAAAILATMTNSFMTGAIINVDGGGQIA
jgi:NAD(P)-dependent dehydrogenase (short-subunit alcohol dehydrogenase family)